MLKKIQKYTDLPVIEKIENIVVAIAGVAFAGVLVFLYSTMIF